MRNDRELLELAAKAAGIELWHEDVFTNGLTQKVSESGILCWNPLEADGHALRLAVKLGLSIVREEEFVQGERIPTVEVMGEQREDGSRLCVMQSLDDHPCVATRRAIVRAAAAIGKAMK